MEQRRELRLFLFTSNEERTPDRGEMSRHKVHYRPCSSYLNPSVPFHLFEAFKQTPSPSASRKPRTKENFFSLLPRVLPPSTLSSFSAHGSLNFLKDLHPSSLSFFTSTLLPPPSLPTSYFRFPVLGSLIFSHILLPKIVLRGIKSWIHVFYFFFF